jgi:hypothetical protein
MRQKSAKTAGILLTLVFAGAVTSFAWDQEEHRLMADSVFASVMRQCDIETADSVYLLGGPLRFVEVRRSTEGGLAFGNQVASLAQDDFAPVRFHERGRSIMEQLRSITPALLDSLSPSQLQLHPAENVIAAYFLSHYQALRTAGEVRLSRADISVALNEALNAEALAQGYLADAFAAGHILSYDGFPFSYLQKRNRIEAHNYHRDRGVYVINGRGDVWQTFGDGLLHWYPASYRMVFEACETSLKEVLVVFYVSAGLSLPKYLSGWLEDIAPDATPHEIVSQWLAERGGPEYYSEVRLPSLMYLPMPVSASWSHRTDEVDSHGVRQHHHYPQLCEIGFHDPDLKDIDSGFLYSYEAVPEWMIPPPLRSASPTVPHELIKTDPNWASVRWIQERSAPPSYKGLLLQMGGQLTIREGYSHTTASLGLGYGIWDDLLLIKNVSAAITYLPSFHQADRHLLMASFGLGIDLPGDKWPKAFRLEGGAAVGLGKDFDDFGPVFAVGLDSRITPLNFTYAGITWRLKYQWFVLDMPVSGPVFEIVLQ